MPEDSNQPKAGTRAPQAPRPTTPANALPVGEHDYAPSSGAGIHAAHPRKLPVKMILIPIALLVVFGACMYFFGPKPKEHGNMHGRPRTVPVSVATAVVQQVPIEVRTTGNIQPYSVVNVVPQVSGQLLKCYFTQGQMVKKGDLLFQIDPRPYQASLEQAKGNVDKDRAQLRATAANLNRDEANVGQLMANLQKDQAQLSYADVEYKRYRQLVQQGAISMEQADQTKTSAAQALATIEADKKQIENAKAVVAADQAQIETAKGTLDADLAAQHNAEIQLGFCQIRSPIDGRTGSLNVYEGNVVAANNATPLVTIAQVQPIYVSFTIPEEFLDPIRRCLANGTLKIQAMIEGVATNSVSGTASFLENTVNTTSGTALLRAMFNNTDGQLYPGQFVDVLVTMPPDGNSVVVPASAVQTTQKGNAVYVVRPDNTVDLVPVDLKRTFGDSAAIGSGLAPGSIVVTDGQLQLVPGASVRIISADGKPTAAAGTDDGGTGGDAGAAAGGHRHRHHRGGGDGADGNAGPGAAPGNAGQGAAPGNSGPGAGSSSWGTGSSGSGIPGVGSSSASSDSTWGNGTSGAGTPTEPPGVASGTAYSGASKNIPFSGPAGNPATTTGTQPLTSTPAAPNFGNSQFGWSGTGPSGHGGKHGGFGGGWRHHGN